MFYVRIENDTAMEIADTTETLGEWKSRFSPSLVWVEGDANTKQGDIYDPIGEIFRRATSSDKYTLDAYKTMGYSSVDAELEKRVSAAEDIPAIGVDYSNKPERKIRANSKRNNKAKGKVNKISGADNNLFDHIDLLEDFADTQYDAIEVAVDHDAVDVIVNGLSAAAWPVWNPIA